MSLEVEPLVEPVQPAPTPYSLAQAGGQYSSASPVVFDVIATPNAAGTAFTVTFRTDVACIFGLDWWPVTVAGATTTHLTDASAVFQHSFTVSGLTPGRQYAFTLNLDPTDTTGLATLPNTFTVQTYGARVAAAQNVTVRFYNFGGTPPPPAGGGTAPAAGNWNTYAWAQYNPKRTSFPN